MATKLKNMRLTSVDLVRAGANQEADICLFKSAEDQEATEGATETEANIFKQFINWLRKSHTEAQAMSQEPVEKDAETFNHEIFEREDREKMWRYTDAINTSICSIIDDDSMEAEEKLRLAKESLGQFSAAMVVLVSALVDPESRYDEIEEVSDVEKTDHDEIEEVTKYNHNHDSATGEFTSGSGGSGGKTKYAPSARRSMKGITVSAKKYTKLCGTMISRYPGIKAGERVTIRDAKNSYFVEADDYGGMIIIAVSKND